MAKSGYFELDNRTDGLYLKIHEAETGGYNPSFEDLVHFCDAKKVPYDSIVQLKTVFDTAHNDAVRVSDCITPFSGWCESSISTDGMKVTAVLYPPTSAMSDADEAEIRSGLASMKIRYGLIEENIRRMVQEKLYFVPVIVAAGTEAVEGYDAELTYNFSTTVSNKPKVNDDGTVDFHKLDLINKVNAGDVVAQIKPEYSGENGMDVYGNVIKPKKVYRKIFKYGRNLKVSDDGLQLISLVTGHVKLENDKVFVTVNGKTEEFDKLIICTPLELFLGYGDPREEEKDLFSKIVHKEYFTMAVRPEEGNAPEISYYFFENMTNETRGHLMVFYHRWSDGVTDQPLVTFTLRNHEGMEDVPFDKAKETTLKDMELCGLKVDKIERIDDWYYFPHVGSKDYADGWYEKVEAMQGKDNTFYAGEVMAFGDMEETVEYSRDLVRRFFK